MNGLSLEMMQKTSRKIGVVIDLVCYYELKNNIFGGRRW